jgi:aspartate carbamoyltransferase catalytic subunit
VNEETLSYAAKDCLIMHPGPVNRGVEMTSMLIDGDSSVIEEQVTSGVAVRMAILYILTR